MLLRKRIPLDGGGLRRQRIGPVRSAGYPDPGDGKPYPNAAAGEQDALPSEQRSTIPIAVPAAALFGAT
jgi:hypothetical protein